MSVFDFNALPDLSHTFSTLMWKGVADVHGINGVLSVDGLLAQARVQPVRSSLSGKLPGAQVFLPRSIPLYGLRTTHLSGKSAGHGNVSARRAVEALSRRHPWPSLPKHLGRRQREQRLAHLGRLRPGAGGQGQTALCRRGFRPGLATECLRPGFDHLYKCRWRVELFFKWIKQYLRIKAFFGTSQNAVKTQIWIAISVYLLVAILKKELKIDRSLGEILQILSITLFEKASMNQVLTRFPLQQEKSQSCKQLILFEF